MRTPTPSTISTRCGWAEGDALMAQYHDHEWGVPIHDSRLLWECLMLEGFQAGLAWITVLRKRDAFRLAFDNFEPAKVAAYTEVDIERLMANSGIIRARAKIVATINGAKIYEDMASKGQGFSDFCWSFTEGKTIVNDGCTRVASSPLSEQISKALKAKGFSFVGPTITYAWMQAIGMVNDHDIHCFRR